MQATKNMKTMFVVVASDNNVQLCSPIPATWLICKGDPIIGQSYEWYLPAKNVNKKSEKYVEVNKQWKKYFGRVLDIKNSYLSSNFIAITENLKQKKFVIVEFLSEDECAELVPSSWIEVDHMLEKFICQWPGSSNASRFAASQKLPTNVWEKFDCIPRKFCETYVEAKRLLIKFCDTSSTEIDDEQLKKRKRKKKEFFDSREEHSTEQCIEPCKIKSKKLTNVKINHYWDGNESDQSDSMLNFKYSELVAMEHAPKPPDVFDIFDDNEQIKNSPDILCMSQLSNENKPEFEENSNPKTSVLQPSQVKKHTNSYLDTQNYTTGDIVNMMQTISHTIMNVHKEMSIIKTDVIKNQELLTEIIDRSRRQTYQATENSFDQINKTRESLKLPLLNMDQLDDIENDEEKQRILAYLMCRHGKCFDAKRTTYELLKLVLSNRLAEKFNMEGRRGEKRAFGRLNICIIMIDCVKDFFTKESVSTIKSYMSDWLKQAANRKDVSIDQ